jgi:hypothetical protein
MLNWAEFEQEEKPAERCFWREVVCAFLIGAILAVIFGPLVGCASESPSPRTEVCYMRLLGSTEDGMSVVMSACVTPEEFKAAQK